MLQLQLQLQLRTLRTYIENKLFSAFMIFYVTFSVIAFFIYLLFPYIRYVFPAINAFTASVYAQYFIR